MLEVEVIEFVDRCDLVKEEKKRGKAEVEMVFGCGERRRSRN